VKLKASMTLPEFVGWYKAQFGVVPSSQQQITFCKVRAECGASADMPTDWVSPPPDATWLRTRDWSAIHEFANALRFVQARWMTVNAMLARHRGREC
jgi:hypothetical protein